MGGAGNGGVVLAVGLLFLSLLSTGQALQCYTCSTFSSAKCETNQNCASPNDSCMRITRPDGYSQYGCRVFSQCTQALINQETGLTNFQLKCCQSNLCNGGVVASPSTALLLILAAALLMMSS